MAAPQLQNVYVRLAANHQLELFTDPQALNPMKEDAPVDVKGDGKSKLQFNFILNNNPGHHNGHIETADLIILPHTLNAVTASGKVFARIKDSPFEPLKDKAHVIQDPGEKLAKQDPGNLGGTVPVQNHGGVNVIEAGQLDIRKVDTYSGPYKYTIVAISDSGEDFDFVDPTVKIEP